MYKCCNMMMMKFMFNVAAMTWMMSDSRIWA